MSIPESQLQTWSHQGSVKQSADTYNTIKNVLEDAAAPYANKEFKVFLQGSYGNDTNIYADSDVDVVICLNSTYYADLSYLDESEKTNYNRDRIVASYEIAEFRKEVLDWLKKRFGSSVKSGKKAIAIAGNGNRRDVDVLPCAQHRRYNSYSSAATSRYNTGIVFWTTDGKEIINFPLQHMENCTSKHQSTSNRFKPNVRIIKNMRNEMIERSIISPKSAPSYYLEGMLWNVPNPKFVNSYGDTFANYWNWLDDCVAADLVCANTLHFLVRDGHDICWNMEDYTSTLTGLRKLWADW